MVLMAMSPVRSRSSRHRPREISPRSAAGLPREGHRQDIDRIDARA
jgi:hypothetical protein